MEVAKRFTRKTCIIGVEHGMDGMGLASADVLDKGKENFGDMHSI